MIAFVRKLVARVRTHGLNYFVIIARTEITQPRFQVTHYVRLALIQARQLTKRRGGASAEDETCLQFIYDLSTSPLTFDFASYLAAAEVERRLRGLHSIEVIFVPGPLDGARAETPEYEAAVNIEARRWRLRHMLIPMLSFLPTVSTYTVCRDRKQAEALVTSDAKRIYPSDYRIFLPRQPDKKVIHQHARAGVPIWPMFDAPSHARHLVRQFFNHYVKGRRAIVITLRNYPYTPQRNSRNADWLAFADSLDPSRYAVIFVNDSETVTGPPPVDFSRHLVFDLASVNLELRLALYEAAWLNMALMQGPTELCWYSETARYLLFIQVGTAAVQSEQALIQNGHRLYADLDFAKPYQHIVWTIDELGSLQRSFAEMEALLDAENAGLNPSTSDGRG